MDSVSTCHTCGSGYVLGEIYCPLDGTLLETSLESHKYLVLWCGQCNTLMRNRRFCPMDGTRLVDPPGSVTALLLDTTIQSISSPPRAGKALNVSTPQHQVIKTSSIPFTPQPPAGDTTFASGLTSSAKKNPRRGRVAAGVELHGKDEVSIASKIEQMRNKLFQRGVEANIVDFLQLPDGTFSARIEMGMDHSSLSDRIHAAIVLQSFYRRYPPRQWFFGCKREKESVCYLQRIIRRFLRRRKFLYLMRERDSILWMKEKTYRAAIAIIVPYVQRIARPAIRRRAAMELVPRIKSLRDRELFFGHLFRKEAGLMIISVFRRHLARASLIQLFSLLGCIGASSSVAAVLNAPLTNYTPPTTPQKTKSEPQPQPQPTPPVPPPTKQEEEKKSAAPVWTSVQIARYAAAHEVGAANIHNNNNNTNYSSNMTTPNKSQVVAEPAVLLSNYDQSSMLALNAIRDKASHQPGRPAQPHSTKSPVPKAVPTRSSKTMSNK